MDTSSRIVQYGLKTAFNYIEKNPEQNLPKLMDWVDKLAGDGPNSYPSQRAAIRKVINNPDNNMYQLIINIPVSYTHLDVYKRQASWMISCRRLLLCGACVFHFQ